MRIKIWIITRALDNFRVDWDILKIDLVDVHRICYFFLNLLLQ